MNIQSVMPAAPAARRRAQRINTIIVATLFVGARDEMATHWIRSRRRQQPEQDAAAAADIFPDGTRAR